MRKYIIGVDVGGTAIKLGVINRSGRITARSNLVTKSYSGNRKKLIQALINTVDGLIKTNRLKKNEISGIGIGLPGLIDPNRGVVNFLPNIPNWKNVPLKKIFEKELKIRTSLENDVNLVTLGEWKYGAGIGVKNMICLTLGTGIGSGLIFNNQLYRGEGYVAGELGHIPLNEKGPDCTCGGFACFERYVGNKELIKKAVKIFKKKDITIPYLRKLARQRDKRALKFWEDTGVHIGNGLVGVVNLLNPTMIIIGGGVSRNHQFMFKAIRKVIRNRSMDVQAKMVKIVRAKLGDDAGIIGAQVLIKDVYANN